MNRQPNKRLFFAFEILSPWPAILSKGRQIREENRHLTIAFLGSTSEKFLSSLSNIPKPPLKVGLSGFFDKMLLLPPNNPRVIAWHLRCLDDTSPLLDYTQTLMNWLKRQKLYPDERHDFMPHVTLCRAPFDLKAWQKEFSLLPAIIKNFHLYESLGQLHYHPIWTYEILAPFEEISHTADIAFQISGESIQQLFHHAVTALAFKYPALLKFYAPAAIDTVDDIIIELNNLISRTDSQAGCPFKAVAFHGEIECDKNNIYHWEMIVDV